MNDTLQADLAANCMRLEAELSSMTQRAEAAEARIKASQEQEPVAYVLSAEEAARTDGRTPVLYIGALPLGKNLYAAPVIPPDVAELQLKLDELEQDAQDEINRLEAQKLVLSNKLSEAKIKAVPEGLRKVSSETLGSEFAKVLHDNLWELYESSTHPGGSNE